MLWKKLENIEKYFSFSVVVLEIFRTDRVAFNQVQRIKFAVSIFFTLYKNYSEITINSSLKMSFGVKHLLSEL